MNTTQTSMSNNLIDHPVLFFFFILMAFMCVGNFLFALSRTMLHDPNHATRISDEPEEHFSMQLPTEDPEEIEDLYTSSL